MPSPLGADWATHSRSASLPLTLSNIHFLTFSARENWQLYHSTAPLNNREAPVQGDLNEHAALQRIQDPRSLPLPTEIMLKPAKIYHTPLPSWEQTLPVASAATALDALAHTIPVPHAPPVPSPAPSPNVDINAIVQAVVQATPVATAASVLANPTVHSPAPTLS